jgi:hypothetical protein
MNHVTDSNASRSAAMTPWVVVRSDIFDACRKTRMLSPAIINMARDIVMPCQGIDGSVFDLNLPFGAAVEFHEASPLSSNGDAVFDKLAFAFPFVELDIFFDKVDLWFIELGCSMQEADLSFGESDTSEHKLERSSSGMAVELELGEGNERKDAVVDIGDSLERKRWSSLLLNFSSDLWF